MIFHFSTVKDSTSHPVTWGCFFHNHQQDAEKWGLLYRQWGLPSGKRLQFAIENGPVEIVDLHIEHVDFP